LHYGSKKWVELKRPTTAPVRQAQ